MSREYHLISFADEFLLFIRVYTIVFNTLFFSDLKTNKKLFNIAGLIKIKRFNVKFIFENNTSFFIKHKNLIQIRIFVVLIHYTVAYFQIVLGGEVRGLCVTVKNYGSKYFLDGGVGGFN